ncbi:MAG: DUF998 domain-containing protein [Spirochaetales bacterium]|nr:DUF998 domain-containing protein [Spirochaetales bacterium]
MKKIFPYFGMSAPIVYLATVLIGGILNSGYNHIYNSVSELTMTGAPNSIILFIMFGIYNLLLVLFGFMGMIYLARLSIRTVFLLLGICGLLGIVMLAAGQDPRGQEFSAGGVLHIIAAGITALLSIITPIVAGVSKRNITGMGVYIKISFMLAVFIFVSGGLTSVAFGSGWPSGGLMERFTIGFFLLWVFITGYFSTRFQLRTLE